MNNQSPSDRLGQILLRRNQIRAYQLEFLLNLQKKEREQKQSSPRLGDLMVKHRVATPLTITEALAFQECMPKKSVTEIVDALFGKTEEMKEDISQPTSSTICLTPQQLRSPNS